jgi:heme-degrading monooxygenase HmoA
VSDSAQPLILINAFEVSEEAEEEFLRGWDAARDYLKEQPGYVDTALHRAVAPGVDFRFVNVARWESAEHFQEAISSEGFEDASKALSEYSAHPGLYEVVRT